MSYQCPRCGSPLKGGERFCPKCGIQFTMSAQNNPSMPPQPQPMPSQLKIYRESSNKKSSNIGLIIAIPILILLLGVGGYFGWQLISDKFMSKINGHEYVDLGLSVKWATCNIGANSPTDYGDYYAWGETSTKSSYDESNGKTYGKTLGDISGDPQYDVARAKWGGKWRVPTKAEMQELIDNCNWEWTTQDGHYGVKITSKINGKSIFFPAAGCRYGPSPHYVGEYGLYWSSTPDESGTHDLTYGLGFISSGHDVSGGSRSFGFSVRPVVE